MEWCKVEMWGVEFRKVGLSTANLCGVDFCDGIMRGGDMLCEMA